MIILVRDVMQLNKIIAVAKQTWDIIVEGLPMKNWDFPVCLFL